MGQTKKSKYKSKEFPLFGFQLATWRNKKQVFNVMTDSWALLMTVYQLYGQKLNTLFPTLITTAQNLAPNNVTSARWQHLYLGYLGFNLDSGRKWRRAVNLHSWQWLHRTPIWGSDLRIKKPSNTEEAVCTIMYLYCRSGRKFHEYGVEDANNKCGRHGWRKNICNTYVFIERSHQPGQVRYATLCFVQLKEPCQILVQPG